MSTFLIQHRRRATHNILRGFFLALGLAWLNLGGIAPLPSAAGAQADHIVLVVLEGISSSTIQSGTMPHLAKLAQEGAVSWSAQSISPPLTVPAMASLLTGLPVEKHRITADWENYDFARSFMRSPTVFDYMDLAGGADTGVFLMDERLYQLIRPEIYVDKQVCGYSKPQCTPETVSVYIQDFLKNVTSGKGYGFWLFGVPELLVTHFPTAARIGQKYGWDSPKYSAAVTSIDNAIDQIMKNYQEIGVLDRTMFIVTGLNSGPLNPLSKKVKKGEAVELDSTIPWIAWGTNIKGQHAIAKPVTLLDTGATIMYTLGLETHTEWESQAITEIFQTKPKRRTTENELEKIYQ
ncbi:MAG: alkaline phosphatase [Nitrospirota bacterium]|nr:alkaline phosphatase [Nitrospirota bacterium]